MFGHSCTEIQLGFAGELLLTMLAGIISFHISLFISLQDYFFLTAGVGKLMYSKAYT